MTAALVEATGGDLGVTCVVGAGGKKTLLYRLADELQRAVVTATVRIPIFDSHVEDVVITADPTMAVSTSESWPVGLVPEREGNRYLGYAPETIDKLASSDTMIPILVKADGARNRLFKAPGRDEPIIPQSASNVLPIASVRAVGKPLDEEFVHRPARVAEITGRKRGEPLTIDDIATVLTSPDGGLKAVPSDATVIPILNMVDDDALESIAREIAARVHEHAAVPRVVLTRLIDDDPVVDVISK